MLILALLADDSGIHREFKLKEVHSYRVHVETDQGGAPMTYDYTFWTRCDKLGAEQTNPELTIQVLDLRQSADGLHVRKPKAGLGKLEFTETLLPKTLCESFGMPAFWGPLLTFYLPPEIKQDAFDVNSPVGATSTLTGHGTYKDGVFDLTGKVEQKKGASDAILEWIVDEKGWLREGEGSLVDSSGTLTFKIRRA